ncbi:MAG: hypothetical protein IKA87_09980 [Lentisphaeria bacterium]|nr:hypothetical protein [Lentisphaeria bacterium]
MEHLDAIAKLLGIIGSFLLGMHWVVRRIEKGQRKLHKSVSKLQKELVSKVSFEDCRRFRYNCRSFKENRFPKAG